MENVLRKKFGLATATATVIGIVIGSGVFFKAEKVLSATGGNLPLGILAWVIGAFIMICCAYTFAVMATKYERVNGLVDYSEAAAGAKYAYAVGWFMSAVYYPAIGSVLAWVSARYTCVLFGFSIVGGECMVIACFYLIASFVLNTLSPVLAARFQVATTIIKLIPLLGMAIIGTLVGLNNGMVAQNFTQVVEEVDAMQGLFIATVATAFAYDGWIVATSINAELRDAKKNLPRALVMGTFTIAVVYITYYIGLSGSIENSVLMESGETGAKLAFQNTFSNSAGTLLFVFVIISCLGTLNGLMLGCTRGFYAIAARGRGPKPEMFSQIDRASNMPANAAVISLLLCAFWLMFFYGSNLVEKPWFGFFSFDSSELPIVTIYAIYIPIFILFMKKETEFGSFKRFVMPVLATIGSCFMIVACVFAHRMAVVGYLAVFTVFMLAGVYFYKQQNSSK